MDTETNGAIRVVFFGSADFSLPSLVSLKNSAFKIVSIITQPDKPTGRGKKVAQNAVKKWAIENEYNVFQPERINNADFYQQIETLNADVFVVAAYGKLLSKTLLNLPSLGAINVHGSLLPKYRGASPIQAAILSGDNKSGACIMLMDEGMDTGPLLAQKMAAILPTDTAGTLGEKIAKLGAELLADTIINWSNKKIIPLPQSSIDVSVCKKITKNDGRIDWSDTSEIIERKIRAFHPWPIAWTTTNNETVIIKIHKAEKTNVSCGNIKPGNIFTDNSKMIFVCCGNNTSLRLIDIQPQDKKTMPAYDYLLGHKELLSSGLF